MNELAPGQALVDGRYRVVRFLARGGMGEVWEAFDEELGHAVALKILRRDVSADPVALQRFRREVNLARRVAHPNVAALYEYGTHRTEDGPLTYLTMELIRGETLEERIRARGALPTGEALAIARQVCAGLEAAHAAGVVHRDVKSGNVMLAGDGRGGTRAVITDFGLARALHSDRGASAITRSDVVVGSPAYMSPEQARGAAPTARSDVYSLGILLFEMVTGALPHEGPSPLAVLMRRMEQPPPSPLALRPSLPKSWDVVIRRCLELDPRARYASAADVVRALQGEWVPSAPPARSRWRRLATAAGTLAFLAAVGALLALRTAPRSRRSAAVLGFRNASGRADTAWLGVALAEMLGAELAGGSRLRTVPAETVARVKAEMALGDTDGLDGPTLGRVAGALGAELVVVGGYTAESAEGAAPVHVTLRLQDAAARENDLTLTENGTAAEMPRLVASLGERLRTRLGIAREADETRPARASFPEEPEAQRLYAEGLAKLRGFEPLAATGLLEKAAEAAPKSALVRSALASAWSALGNDPRARAAAQAAYDLSADLPREDRLLIEAQLAEAKSEWPRAVEDYRALRRFFPDDVEYALRLASAEGVAAVPRASLVVIAAGCASFGLPAEAGVAMILAVDELMDMARTSINVVGNCVAAVVVARWEGVMGTPRPEDEIAA